VRRIAVTSRRSARPALALVGAFRSRASLEAENMILRHQLNVLQRKSSKRPTFGMLDRQILAGLYRLAPKVVGALAIVRRP
jgi:hypothetical protein